MASELLGFAALLREFRTRAGLTQAGLAELATLSPQAVSTLERGKRTSPRRETVLLLAEALRLSAHDRARLLYASRPDSEPPPEPIPGTDSPERADVPRMLPPTVGDFTGRERQIAELTTALSNTTSVGVAAVVGMGGVGKTALAVHVAHQLADEFPDGQLYVDLRGFGPDDPMPAGQALSMLLAALGVPANEIPVDPVHAAGRYRSLLAGKRVLVVLDNASDAQQALDLLPGTAGSAVIVTSRRSLTTLPGVQQIQLDTFSDGEAIGLLASVAGDSRIEAEPAAVRELIRRCGHLPLAIRIVGARLAARPPWPVSLVNTRLGDKHRQLDELEHHDLGVRSSLGLSLEQLAQSDDPRDRQAVEALVVLTFCPGPDIGIPAAAALLDVDTDTAERLMERLVDNGLLETRLPGRYRFHDLVGIYAQEYGAAQLPPTARPIAIERLLKLYAGIAWRLADLQYGLDERQTWYDADLVGPLPTIDDEAATTDWFYSERRHIRALIRLALGMSERIDRLTVQLTTAMFPVYQNASMMADYLELGALTRERAEPAMLGIAWHDMAAALGHLGRWNEAVEGMRKALDLFEKVDDQHGRAAALCNLSYLFALLGRIEEGIRVGHQALEIASALESHSREVQCYLSLGILYGHEGNSECELDYYDRALTLLKDADRPLRLARALNNIGIAHRRAHRLVQSAEVLQESITVCQRNHLTTFEIIATVELARTQLEQDKLADALAHGRTSAERARILHDQTLEARALQVVGCVLDARGLHDEARAEWTAARTLYAELGAKASVDDLELLISPN
ncbi:ATP-binding protein [Kribbella deserti]|uniref:Tetratricopeptide repeat protein n=1 Tax=Kribbella deserti TaxID=1926257 RepID=A0ABV6QQB8_9ACTN